MRAARALLVATALAPGGPAVADEWSLGASVFLYHVPDDEDYAQPTFTADRGSLHLEARYNYEELDSGSAWAGYNLSGGEKLAWEVTPMLGLVIGELSGIAPGYAGSVGYGKLELYSEGEYLVDPDDSRNNFLYSWSELSVAPWDWLRFGLVTQRTRVYESDRAIERGILVGFSTGELDVTGYVFDPDDGEPLVVLGIGLGF